MPFVIAIVMALVTVYGLVWAILMTSVTFEQNRIAKVFKLAFDENTYVIERDMYRKCLILKVNDGHGKQLVRIDPDGKLASTVEWSQSSSPLARAPTKALRKRLEPMTGQIAVLYKLEHGEWYRDDGMNEASSPY